MTREYLNSTWMLEYKRSTSQVEQWGLQTSPSGFFTENGYIEFEISHHLTIKRNPFSSSPVFVYVGEDRVIAASHYLLLLKSLKSFEIEVDVDVDYAADYIRYQCPWTFSTFCRQIQIVRNAEKLYVPRNGATSRSFLSLRQDGSNTEVPMESLLIAELSKLEFNETVFHISSGLDSSLLVLLACQIVPPREVFAVSCITRGHGASDEIDIVKKLRNDVGFNLEILDFTETNVFEAGAEMIDKCTGYPSAHPSHLVEYLIDKEMAGNYQSIVSGRGPDECLAGYQWHAPEYAELTRYISRLTVTPSNILDSIFTNRAGIHSNDNSLVNYLCESEQGTLTLKDRLEIDQRMISESWNIVHSGIEYGIGKKIVKPFQTPKLSSALFNLDEAMMYSNGVHKKFMRDNFSHIYKSYLLNVPKQGFRLDMKPYISDYPEYMNFVMENEFTTNYLDRSFVEAMYFETVSGEKNLGWQLWSIYLLSISFALINS